MRFSPLMKAEVLRYTVAFGMVIYIVFFVRYALNHWLPHVVPATTATEFVR